MRRKGLRWIGCCTGFVDRDEALVVAGRKGTGCARRSAPRHPLRCRDVAGGLQVESMVARNRCDAGTTGRGVQNVLAEAAAYPHDDCEASRTSTCSAMNTESQHRRQLGDGALVNCSSRVLPLMRLQPRSPAPAADDAAACHPNRLPCEHRCAATLQKLGGVD